jgi:hypothetical protein
LVAVQNNAAFNFKSFARCTLLTSTLEPHCEPPCGAALAWLGCKMLRVRE